MKAVSCIMYRYNKLDRLIQGAVRLRCKAGIVSAQVRCCNLWLSFCFSELDWPLQDSAWTRYRWEWDITAEAQVLFLRPEYRLTGPRAVELAVRAGSWCNTGWHTPCHAGEGMRVCWHSVSHSVWRPQWEQTPTRLSWVSNIATVHCCFISGMLTL